MRAFIAFGFVLLVALAKGLPKPQDGVSADDILANDARYGQDSGKVDQGTLDALFGGLKGVFKGTPGSKGTLVKPAPEKQKEPNYGTPAKTIIDKEPQPCTYYFDAGYRCVPYYQCQNGVIVTDGGGLFDIRSGLGAVTLDPEKSKCPGDLEVCCLHPDFEKLPPPSGPPPPAPIPVPVPVPAPVPAVPLPVPVNPPLPPPGPVNPPVVPVPGPQVNPIPPPSGPISPGPGAGGGPYTGPLIVEPPRPKQYVPGCGQRHNGGIGVRIQNNKDDSITQFGEWPHMCAVLNKSTVANEDVNLYVCGCSLISDRVVLTAAHCINNMNPVNIKVRAGEWDTQKTIEPQVHQDRFAKHISIHPGFSPLNLQNDFALIHLAEPFILAPHIDTACLPDNLHIQDSFYPQGCFATGWGKDRFGKPGEYQVIMKKVALDMVPRDVCENQLRKTRLGQFFNLDRSFVCAGGKPGKDTCTGDGGGPLVCPRRSAIGEPESYVQVGIVAWGIGCGEEIPGVYANVSQALCFIDWATRCVEGPQANLYGFIGCEDWAKKEYCTLKINIQILNDEESLISPDNYVERGKIRKQRRKLEELIPRYEAALNGCGAGNHDLTCGITNAYGEVDLSPNQRDASAINTAPRTALIEEEPEEGSGESEEGETTIAPEETPAEAPAETPEEAPEEAPVETPAE